MAYAVVDRRIEVSALECGHKLYVEWAIITVTWRWRGDLIGVADKTSVSRPAIGRDRGT